ncbi:alpha-glucuronidase [bacterium]|nr:alpha-glucuronidase [bacterium]
MRFCLSRAGIILLICFLQCSNMAKSHSDCGHDLWLKYQKIENKDLLEQYSSMISVVCVSGSSATCQIIRDEMYAWLSCMYGEDILVNTSLSESSDLIIATPKQLPGIEKQIGKSQLAYIGDEGFIIQSMKFIDNPVILITASQDQGLLYGAFHFLRMLQTGRDLYDIHIMSRPKIQYRLLNHWDNVDGSVERGYAGKSLWKWDELPDRIDLRYKDYARANASIGINGVVLNNVNANPTFLTLEYLNKAAKLADVFRPYGIRVFLSVNFSSPISAKFHIEGNRRAGIGDLPDSDPLNPDVRMWWKEKAAEIYRLIPDFGGFLVKANSESMPGPQEYGRTHADGANMLAEALAPFGGVVMWRSFVYNANVDPDRAKRAYMEFVPLDGQFKSNVFVQSKNGPVDFQPREPVHPLFGAMPQTPLMLELQITQEYLGHSTHLVYLAPMWKEYLQFDTHAKGEGSTLSSVIDGSLHDYKMTGIAGVSNIGDDTNWTGHFFAQANWYAFGRLAWDHELTAEQIADEWIRMSLTQDDSVANIIQSMMMGSREACVNYMTPLGLHHIMQAGFHYGPQPSFAHASRLDWTSVYYHKAGTNGIGFDRSSTGSNAVSQYFSPWKERFNSPDTCPEIYLLWFHHLPWTYSMKSGRTLWEEFCLHYYAGTDYVDHMVETWKSLQGQVDDCIYQEVSEKLIKHQQDAYVWRDTCLKYFQKFSQREIVQE